MGEERDLVEPNPGWARENNGPRVLGVTVTMTTLGFLFVLARIYCRFISVRKLAVDDYIVVLTTVSYLSSLWMNILPFVLASC
jgi:hypothetical protein